MILIWQEGNKSVPVFPWDTPNLLMHRISHAQGIPTTHLRVQQNLTKILEDWEEDLEVNINVSDISNGWDNPDMIAVIKSLDDNEDLRRLFVQYKTESGEIDEQLWDTLFRHDFQDISFDEWQEQVSRLQKEQAQLDAISTSTTKLYMELVGEERMTIAGWKSERHLIRFTVRDKRTLVELFSSTNMGDKWRLLLLYQKFFQWGEKNQWVVKTQRHKDPSLIDLFHELQNTKSTIEPGIYMHHTNLPTPVSIVPSPTKKAGIYDVGMEVSDDFPDFVDQVWEAMGVDDIMTRTDIGMVGSFIFPKVYIDFTLFQDMCMNDPAISHFLYINELNKSSFDASLGVNLHQHIKDVLDAETPKYHDFTLRNTHRQNGFQVFVSLHTPLSSHHLQLFFLLLRQIVGRYVRLSQDLVDDYTHYIPNFKTSMEKTQNALIKNIKSNRPEYIAKYPRMFVRNLYSVICQKNLQPKLIEEDETYDLTAGSFIRFPPKPIAELNPEYYYCPNKDYPYAGLKEMDLKGKDVFINLAPCCFNSPQDKDNERKLARIRTKDDEEDEEDMSSTKIKTNIISGKFLIKHPGQLGTIRPPSMNRFFMAYDPSADYYRVGTEQSPSSLLHCMLTRRTMMNLPTPLQPNEVRIRISQDRDCINACLQENPGMTWDEIRQDIANPNVYFDPRRFYRAVELYFGVRLLVFSKGPDFAEEDASLLSPFSMRTHYTNSANSAFIIVYEHWGGKTNILSKYKHPHCELICYKIPTTPIMRLDFSSQGVENILDNSIFPFDGNYAIQPLLRKECWFFRHIIGQTTDPLGKVRWLHFQYYNQNFYAEVNPPLAIQDDIGVGDLPDTIPILPATSLLRFLNKFDHWECVNVPNPDQNIVYWRVSQDNAFWKNPEETSKIYLTFACRIRDPRPTQVLSASDGRYIISSSIPTTTLYQPPNTLPSIRHDDKIADTLSQWCVHSFSWFLKENKVRQDATDIDTLLSSFFNEKILIDPHYPYRGDQPPTHEKRLVLPSTRFWNKIMFHLKWLIFYHPQYVFDPEKTTPHLFQNIGDFVDADPTHYYCSLDNLYSVIQYSVEDLYEVVSCPITDLPAVCRERKDLYVAWYNKEMSPYPHPSIILLYPSIQATDAAIHIWRTQHKIMPTIISFDNHEEEEDGVYEWEPSLQTWKNPNETTTTQTPMFRARVKDDEYLLFFPISASSFP